MPGAAPPVTEADAPDDAHLATRSAAGDLKAFGALIRRHERAIWHISLLASADRATSENLVQQTFLQAYERLATFDPRRDFGTWLRSIARNLARDEVRRAARQRRQLASYRDHLLTLLDEGAATDERAATDDDARQQRAAEALRACREQLAPAAQKVIALRYDQGMALPDVATALGRTVTATRQLLFRARLFLRACVERQGVETT